MTDTNKTATLTLDGKSYDLPVLSPSAGPDVVDIRKLYAQADVFTYDPGFTSTASCDSSITNRVLSGWAPTRTSVTAICAQAEAAEQALAAPALERVRDALEAALADVAAYRHELMLRGLRS